MLTSDFLVITADFELDTESVFELLNLLFMHNNVYHNSFCSYIILYMYMYLFVPSSHGVFILYDRPMLANIQQLTPPDRKSVV